MSSGITIQAGYPGQPLDADLTAVAASGAAAAWASYSPTVTAQTGTFTTVSATGFSLTIGKFTAVRILITVTTVGSATGYVQATLPNTGTSSECWLAGRESAITGKECGGRVITSTGVRIFLYDGTTPAATGASISVSGIYENS